MQVAASLLVRNFARLPTNGSPDYHQEMPAYGQFLDEKQIVAANLERLQDYALDHPETGWPANKKALARWLDTEHKAHGTVKINRATVQRMMKAETAAAVDTLGAVARAYGLLAWQLLIPDLDPANPPVVSVTETERRLWQRMHDVADQFRAMNEEEAQHAAQAARRPPRAHRDRASQNPAPRSARPKLPKAKHHKATK